MGTSDKIWTREEVCSRILAGETLFIYNGKLIRVPPSWLAKHPGGRLAILHFVGRDATDEVNAFHPEAALKQLNKYSIGRVAVGPNGWEPLVPPVMTGWVRQKNENGEEKWEREAETWNDSTNEYSPTPSSEILLVKKEALKQPLEASPTMSSLTPPPTTLNLKTQQQHMKAYRVLHAEITKAGLYKTPYLTGYGPEVARYTFMAVVSVLAYRYRWFWTSAFFLGCLFHQLTFTVHDLGHNGVTHIWAVDRAISILISDFTGGLSTGWWVDNHNIHHLVTNHPSHDPDIQHIPFFAISPKFLNSLWSSYYKRIMAHDAVSKIFLSVQHKLFYVVMSLARFNLYANSYGFLIKSGISQGRRGWTWWLEVVGIVFYWTWYINVLKGCGDFKTGLGFFLISHVVPSPLHIQIVLSHFSRSTEDLGPTESFLARQLRTTTDVICPPHLAFFHGGLHLQVTHHLFPRLPRHNLAAASQIVKRYAAEQGLEYAEFGFVAGNREVVGVLADVASQVGVVGMVAKNEVEKAVRGEGH
ncbi:delta 8-sphingolipid desaturase [Rhizoctonia solani 123E]|uniref:Delta 8-(E)-sphingolipid desaturase n=1 Tax=Rhizoctonia solani 123E TaxID=1423351 RepID=A0A074S1A8_9AGAM|nr:delta 8-sphingolipid desaturase [Rhizoctonia solani 123E]